MSWFAQKNAYRRGARNTTHTQAQARIHESRQTFQEKVFNSLQVEGHDCLIFHRLQYSTPCSCRKVLKDSGLNPEIQDDTEISFMDSDFFGDQTGPKSKVDDVTVTQDSRLTEAQEFEINDLLSGNDISMSDRAIDDRSVACGICYSEGYVPPFTLIGHTLETVVPTDMQLVGCMLNQAAQPSMIEAVSEDACVEFELFVPYDTQQVFFSGMNNTAFIPMELLFEDRQVTKLDFIHNIGKTIKLKALCPLVFTHLRFLFHTSSTQKVNCSALSSSMDFESMYTIQSLNVVLPHNYCNVASGDFIYLKRFKLMLKVNDVTPKHDSENKIFEYSVATRVCQPSEVIRTIVDLDQIY